MAERTRHLLDGFETELGQRLRALRREHRHSLTDVAVATGISPSFISHIENGKSDITIGRLLRLARFYGIDVSELLPKEPEVERHVIRAGHHTKLHSSAEALDVFLLAPDLQQHMMPCLTVYQEGGRTEDFFSSAGESFLYVLKGEVTVSFTDGDKLVLRRGDSAYFRTDRPHTFSNSGRGGAELLSCATADAQTRSEQSIAERPTAP
jgi:transcriptional regulator with XRE-family HTH domain